MAKGEEDIEEYRKKLLSGIETGEGDNQKRGLEFEDIDWDNVNPDDFDSDDLDALENGKAIAKGKAKNTPDIQFTTGFGEDIGKELLKKKDQKQKESKLSAFEKYQEKKRISKRGKKEAGKLKREQEKKMARMSETEIAQLEKNRKQLEMLVGDSPDEDEMMFKGDKADSRFAQAVHANKEFALDPTHKDFHKMAGGAPAPNQNKYPGKNSLKRRRKV